MKKISTLLLFIILSLAIYAHGGKNFEASDIFETLKEGDKVAILMVHFGTTHNDTRALTIDAINDKVKKEFTGTDVREAYTSRIVIKRLGEKGIVKRKPLEELKQLAKDGYTHILVQSTMVIDGVEMESLAKDIEQVQSLFKEVRIGDPLLYTPEDYHNVIAALTKQTDGNTAYVWVGHGTYDATTAQYAMLDYMLKSEGHKNYLVGTIEGYPTFDNMMAQLNQSGLKNVVLVPFMFVAGEHAKNDIAGDWKSDIEKAGYTVSVRNEGLGQIPAIQDLYISHLKFIAKHRRIDIMHKKSVYEVTGQKMD